MRIFTKNLFILFIFSMLTTNLFAQYGAQVDNRGFEQWTSREEASVNEPVHWHSGGTATGSYSGWVDSQIESSTHVRPGSTGSKSVRLYPERVLGVTANGNLTNGPKAPTTRPSTKSPTPFRFGFASAVKAPPTRLK